MDERFSAGKMPPEVHLSDSSDDSPKDTKEQGATIPVLFGFVVGAFLGVLLGLGLHHLTAPLPPDPKQQELRKRFGMKLDPVPVEDDRPLWVWPTGTALVGGLLGGLIGFLKWVFNSPTNIATTIGLTFGLVPAVLVLAAGGGLVRGAVSALIVVGLMGVGSAIGMLFGALADRFYDRFLLPPEASTQQRS